MNAFMALAVTVAYFVKGLCGFANTLVFTTLMSFQMNNVSLSPIDLLTGFPANLLLAWRERKNAKSFVWGPLSIVVLLGVVPGAIFLKNGNAQSIKLLFGGVVVYNWSGKPATEAGGTESVTQMGIFKHWADFRRAERTVRRGCAAGCLRKPCV